MSYTTYFRGNFPSEKVGNLLLGSGNFSLEEVFDVIITIRIKEELRRYRDIYLLNLFKQHEACMVAIQLDGN